MQQYPDTGLPPQSGQGMQFAQTADADPAFASAHRCALQPRAVYLRTRQCARHLRLQSLHRPVSRRVSRRCGARAVQQPGAGRHHSRGQIRRIPAGCNPHRRAALLQSSAGILQICAVPQLRLIRARRKPKGSAVRHQHQRTAKPHASTLLRKPQHSFPFFHNIYIAGVDGFPSAPTCFLLYALGLTHRPSLPIAAHRRRKLR